uniref:Chitinase 25-1 n=1 Tax=Plutella xylostella TaxID=51655 RepID=A0A451ER01_PLUXY|nr:chitinase 25-1 [Plutella xylostella]
MKAVVLILGFMLCAVPALGDGVSICYWGAWANYRPELGAYGVSDLPADLCTHLVYSFIGLDGEGNLTLAEEIDVGGKSSYIKDFIKLRETYPKLKLIVAVGGYNEGSADFSKVCNNDTLRAYFVSNLVQFVEESGFDGLDLDWEYPGQREGSQESDKQAFVDLVRDLKEQLGPKGLELMAAVPITQWAVGIGYDVANISKHLDYISLMTYDMHGTWENVTGSNAPLYGQLTDPAGDVLNVQAGLNVWLTNGAPASKLVLGLPSYGKSFTLASLDHAGTGAPHAGGGAPGAYTGETGTLAYYEICLAQQQSSWNVTVVKDNYAFASSGLQWVGYDDPSITFAKGRFAKQNKLAGVMYWATDLDDFAGYCSRVTYPIIKAGIKGFNSL